MGVMVPLPDCSSLCTHMCTATVPTYVLMRSPHAVRGCRAVLCCTAQVLEERRLEKERQERERKRAEAAAAAAARKKASGNGGGLSTEDAVAEALSTGLRAATEIAKKML